MDVVALINNINGRFGALFWTSWSETFNALFTPDSYEPIYLLVVAFITSVLTGFVLLSRRWEKKVEAPIDSLAPGSRFRKRDKALFYGRKMLRKVKSISGQVRSGQGRKRKMVMKFARRILQLKKDNEAEQLKVLEPPAEYLQEDLSDEKMPSDLLYMFQNIRVFGYFEKPFFLKLCKHTEIMTVNAGSFLFKIGDLDENIYIVQSGKVNVYICNPDGSTVTLKTVKNGESVASLLSFIDVLTRNGRPYKTVYAKAMEDSTIVRLPMSAFNEVFHENPELLIRVIQVIMVRLQRVTFTALHDYLGLSGELIIAMPRPKKSSQMLLSPNRRTKREDSTTDTTGQYTPTVNVDASLTSQPIPIPLSTKRVKNTPDMIPDESKFQKTPDIHLSSRKMSLDDMQVRVDCEQTDRNFTNIALEAFEKELGLTDRSALEGCIEIREVPSGTYLMKEESHKDVALVYLLTGSLIVSQRTAEEDNICTYTAHSGEFVGGLAVLTGEPSFFSVRAKHFSRIALLLKSTFYNLVKENPKVILNVANLVIRRLTPFVRQVDFALDWIFIEAGRAVYRQDEDSDSTYVVLSGRLRSVITHANGKKELVAEYGKADLLGIVEMVTHTKRSTTVIAVRDTELAKLPEGLFDSIKLKYPIVVTRLINLLGHRILGAWKNASTMGKMNPTIDTRPTQLNFSTVAIVPCSDDVPLTSFAYELYHCLTNLCATTRLTSEIVRKALGSTIMDPSNEYRLTSWLAQQEDQNKICLYQCDASFTTWTQRCLRQADCILIVGLGEKEPTVGRIEREIERVAMRTQKELILLHKETSGKPQNTVAWLNMRSWISSHHHILCPKRMFTIKSVYRINELYSKVCLSEPNIHSDFSRLARWLTGRSVGLVLGGGGARGSAHIGMIKAIMEAGIPIDMVGGVSIGAFMGALWCKERNITTVTQMAREWSRKMTQWWRQILDLTYPMTSMFSGRDFNQTIKSTFGDTYIEDLWLPYFTVTTDITESCMRMHNHALVFKYVAGSLWRYVRSSMSLSGYMPPLCDPIDGHLLLDGGYVNNLPGFIWRYVRASMTYVGIFPPMCDPIDGHFLVDGCYTNNVPADVMRAQGASHIYAIDVGSVDDQDLTNYGDDLSGWWLLWKRWNPFAKPVKVPNLPDIQSRLAYVSCVRQLEEVKASDYCEYIRPPIDKYKTLQFGSFDEIKEVGYQHGRAYFESKLLSGLLPMFNNPEPRKLQQQQSSLTNYTFTDLAQMVCKVQKTYDDSSSSESDEEDYDEFRGYASEPSVGTIDNKAKECRRPYGSFSENEMEADSDLEITMDDEKNEKKVI